MQKNTFVGTAGWVIPGTASNRFPGEGQHLLRYSRTLRCAEINSSFKRSHRFEVYRRWAAMTPPDFRFAVKMPAEITHRGGLADARVPLERFLAEVAGLGDRLGVLLVQLPPSLAFEARRDHAFFELLSERHGGAVVCEPRHPSWLEPVAEQLLAACRVGRVAADPVKLPRFGIPGGWLGADGSGRGAVVYCRLHGAPRMYWSRYADAEIRRWAERIAAVPSEAQCWCIFDNTASGAAATNALQMVDALARHG